VAAVARARRALFSGSQDTLLGAVVAVVACVLLVGARYFFHQDSWLALVVGRSIWHDGIPQHDFLTVLTEGRRWVDQQWLSQLAIYGLFRLGGLALVAAVHVALVAGSLAAALAIGRRRGSEVATQLIVLLVGLILVLLPSLVVRTQPYAYPLFVATLFLLSSDSRAPSARVYWTLPLLVLWGNVHGSAALGAGMVALRGLTILAQRRSPPGVSRHARVTGVALMIAAPLCLLATPYGTGMPSYYRETLLNPDFTQLVSEWRPVTDVPVAAVPFFLLAALALWSMGREPKRLTLWERVVLIVLLAGGIAALRNVVWAEFALLMLPAFAVRVGSGDAVVRRRLNQGIAITLAVAVVACLVIDLTRSDHEFEKGYPPGVLAAVAHTTAGPAAARVFADPQYADWLLWRLPGLRGRVAFDARFELQPSGALERLARALTATGIDWKRPVRGFRLVVLAPSSSKEAARGFRAEPGRRILFDDADGLVVLRSAAQARS
jgi:hypothetical protein